MLSFLILALLSCSANTQPAPQEPPTTPQNILLIVIDTLRADYLGFYGAPSAISPNLDQLASKSVVIQQHFSTSSWTRPGFATILTGLYPREAGIYEESFDRLPENILTLPEILQQHHYKTIAINSNPNIDPYFGFDQGFEQFEAAGTVYGWMKEILPDEEQPSQHGLLNASVITDKSVSILTDTKAPWFSMIVYIDPHKPLSPPAQDRKAIDGISQYYHPEYAAEVHYVDREIQRLLNELQQQGTLDNTWVIITSDHGEGLWSHPSVPFSFEHGTHLYDSVNRVPLLIHHPSLQPRNIPDLTSAISLFPTILDLLNIPHPKNPERPSLADLIQLGKQPNLPPYVFSETQWQRLDKISVRSTDQRYIYSYDAQQFQQHNQFEGIAPLNRQQLLEGPIDELYSYSDNAGLLSTLLSEPAHIQEGWDKNLPNASASPLKTVLLDWVKKHPQRPPLQRTPNDGYTHFTGSPNDMKELSFHPLSNLPAVEEPDQALQQQLKSLGYLE